MYSDKFYVSILNEFIMHDIVCVELIFHDVYGLMINLLFGVGGWVINVKYVMSVISLVKSKSF